MRRVKFWSLLLVLVLVLPYLLLFLAGFLWLKDNGMLWWFLLASVVLTLALWPLARLLRRKKQVPRAARPFGEPAVQGFFADSRPDRHGPPSAQKAWEEVEALARRVQTEDLPLDQPERIWQVFREVLETVARQYHPRSGQAPLEVTIPQVLLTAELVARDLREAFSENVPGADMLTLGDFRRVKKVADWGQHLYSVYRVLSLGFRPVTSLVGELRGAAAGNLMLTSTEEIKQWAVGFCIRKAGHYAIRLYSGQQLLEDPGFRTFQTPESKADARRALTLDEKVAEEPLRILVLGRIKSGKSSVVNALCGQMKAATDPVARTRGTMPYVLEREDIPRAIVLDTAGYDEGGHSGPFGRFKDDILQSDLILLVCSAASAARGVDRRLLDDLRAFFQKEPHRVMPPAVVALTHVDELGPPDQWSPPYDLASPVGPKAENIAAAVRAVAEDLAPAGDRAVVPVCTRPDRLYNVDDGLVPAILNVISEADRVKQLRCVRQFQRAQRWPRLWRQAVSSGRGLWKAAAWLGRKRSR